MLLRRRAPGLFLVSTAFGQTLTTATKPTSSAQVVTAISECHMHDTTQFCMAGTTEFQVHVTATGTSALPASYTGCHVHGTDNFCISPFGDEVSITQQRSDGDSTHGSSNSSPSAATSGRNCHFHAGVEHCTGGNENEEHSCERINRDYNIPLRIGFLFVMLVTSAFGVLGPIFLTSFTKVPTDHIALVLLKQFGTGVLISTAFVHLFTHAYLMFENDCVGEMSYEATVSAIFIAGAFLSFLVEYAGHRITAILKPTQVRADDNELESHSQVHDHPVPSDAISAAVLEAGIVFHSLLIGLTCVVADDSFFRTLFAVIVFHQMFEGIALGTVISGIPNTKLSFTKKMILGGIFTIITPIGMGIGIGVLSRFNGNDRSTLIAIGTLDALSAGILAWVAFVEMWARDWIHGGRLERASLATILAALLALALGIGIMSLLGKWA
ncbi:Zip-domain-containing protein [Eremomyces bilateralis CBS 781.70]|uniref:Zip-domain-containing protein n=1 Tax=Eremomyces bilateralis CBS 781.70 TaxID=1392243 RepID=A0A6G1FRB0_9PEZI|nr:Zip-domain-containing protein [Eremomyces bilateralis CBS 781.70]KAF1808268.1 Zip-domain-containing protein [Eremomyces bilateralis CBS 781.70]